MSNTNCLENIRCPECGQKDEFKIEATTLMVVTDDGTEVDRYAETKWTKGSYICCPECERVGTVAEFTVKERSPRIPADEQEAFAMAFMVGYMGEAPDELVHAFPDEEEWRNVPGFISSEHAHAWKRGYDCGVAFFCDHALDEEG